MKTQRLSLGIMALGCALAGPAFAQNSSRYEPILEKRADLRMQYLHAQRAAGQPTAKGADDAGTRLHRTSKATGFVAQGNPYLADFLSLSGKRADLRIAVTREGLDAAFAHWLRRERPSAFADWIARR